MNDLDRMKELIIILNEANKAYYQDAREIMSNLEYDELYDELISLENKLRIVYPDSPTQNVGTEVTSKLPKWQHQEKMLSLDKTKNIQDLIFWLGDKEGIISWKLDGLTVVLTYNNGELIRAVTRGNGVIGEVITDNVKHCKNVPLKIPYKEELILRGEAVISYEDFNNTNAKLPSCERFKNPRNLASGSIRALDSADAADRKVQVIIFRMITELEEYPTMEKQFSWLESMGFNVVEYYPVSKENIDQVVKFFERKIQNYSFPSDGLVISFNDTAYGNSLGSTAKFSKHSFAFKWQDEMAETVLREIEWNPSRTGLINPVAIFDPVELEGTTVERASLHNISIIEDLNLGIGDKIQVYKANMIIPQIAENLTRSGNLEIPDTCPVCRFPTVIEKTDKAKVLKCTNEFCPERMIAKFEHFCSRNAMNIIGLSEATLEFLIKKKWISCYADIYKLEKHKREWVIIPGYGAQSVANVLTSIEDSRNTTPEKLLNSLGIPKIGMSQSEAVFKEFNNWEEFIGAIESGYNFTRIEGFGEVLNHNIHSWYDNFYQQERIPNLIKELKIEKETKKGEDSFSLTGKTFVITGSLYVYKNREELTKEIKLHGGKVGSSVTSKTDYLINNDANSTSSKNQKAKILGIPIISEEEFQELIK